MASVIAGAAYDAEPPTLMVTVCVAAPAPATATRFDAENVSVVPSALTDTTASVPRLVAMVEVAVSEMVSEPDSR